ncbi:MAG: PhzF family phenazine biosynthesis protein [Oceanospirillaceae bacterium]|nr:PhzF family phenazine biosynthesis protein [Oceanospirillaceae bacterium]
MRYFCSDTDSGENPVTGSIHTGLAAYWAQVLDKTELQAYRASSRGGELHCVVTPTEVIIFGRDPLPQW